MQNTYLVLVLWFWFKFSCLMSFSVLCHIICVFVFFSPIVWKKLCFKYCSSYPYISLYILIFSNLSLDVLFLLICLLVSLFVCSCFSMESIEFFSFFLKTEIHPKTERALSVQRLRSFQTVFFYYIFGCFVTCKVFLFFTYTGFIHAEFP